MGSGPPTASLLPAGGLYNFPPTASPTPIVLPPPLVSYMPHLPVISPASQWSDGGTPHGCAPPPLSLRLTYTMTLTLTAGLHVSPSFRIGLTPGFPPLPLKHHYQPSPYRPPLANVPVHIQIVIFCMIKCPSKELWMCHPFHQVVVLPVVQTEIHLTRPLIYLHTPSLQSHICLPVVSIWPFILYHLLRVHVHATSLAPQQGGWTLL